ncbi:class I SAM-dependent methyltransferase [Roseobacter sinensis]|uniref:Class I SAM-dependent methyltransferase n=1 Tax=Roseobacter sinensis TaxID=2931391 RepID=A0ABT3BDA9_9RHOB|nr:class I SAM-dependent methyltransferase [Roseobacter sp. WL0113]MCV3271555.1 class I SAM-dependent methyltransferase [Roseobacter sp. WL0113]
MSDPETLKVYAKRAQDYARRFSGDSAQNPHLMDFIAALPKGGHVLDLGCGPGTSAARMAEAALRVTAFDPVPEMVALAAAHPGVEARVAGFDDVTGHDLYDGVWANFSLLHAPRSDMPHHLAAIASALKPGGRFHIGMKTGTGEKRDPIGRLYTYYMDAELTWLLKEVGLTVTDRTTGRGKGLDGVEADWICLAAHG